jgi:hypothetical protein
VWASLVCPCVCGPKAILAAELHAEEARRTQEGIQQEQQKRNQCRIYVGSLHYELKEVGHFISSAFARVVRVLTGLGFAGGRAECLPALRHHHTDRHVVRASDRQVQGLLLHRICRYGRRRG